MPILITNIRHCIIKGKTWRLVCVKRISILLGIIFCTIIVTQGEISAQRLHDRVIMHKQTQQEVAQTSPEGTGSETNVIAVKSADPIADQDQQKSELKNDHLPDKENPTLETNVMDNMTSISSTYLILKDDNKASDFSVSVEKQRFFSQMTSEESYYITIYDFDKTREHQIVFSKKHMPGIELVNHGVRSNIVFKDTVSISESLIWIKMKEHTLEDVADADQIYLDLYTKNGDIKKIEIPKSVALQWSKVVTTDMKKLRSELNSK